MRSITALLCVVLGLLLVGCGGGGGGGGSEVDSTNRLRAQMVPGSNPAAVSLEWDRTSLDDASIVEYQIYRDTLIVGVTDRTVRAFVDEQATRSRFTYQKLQYTGDVATGIVATTASGADPLESGRTYRYRVLVIYTRQQEGAVVYDSMLVDSGETVVAP